MALRAREIYYFVRVGNYASRPLRALSGDMARLGAAGDNAARKMRTLDLEQQKLAAARARLVTRQTSLMPGGTRVATMQARQQALVARNLENQRKQLSAIQRAESRIITLNRSRYDIETRILRTQQLEARYLNALKNPRLTGPGRAAIQERRMVNVRRMTSAQAALGENVDAIAAANAQLENQKRLLVETRRLAAGYGEQFAREQAIIDAALVDVNRQLAINTQQLRNNAIAQQEVIAAEREHTWNRIALASRALSDLGRSAQFAGIIVVAALGYMAHAAAQFKTQVTLAATQVGNNFSQVQTATTRMMNAILRQMRRFPASAADMAKASYDIFSSLQLSGNQAQQTAQGIKVLDLANRAAVAGQTNVVDVTRAGITILNDFGKANKNASVNVGLLQRFMNRAFAAVRYGRMTFQEFTQALTSTAPAAKAANQTFDSMSGALAFLTTRIPSVRTAGIAYARLLEVLQRSSKGLLRHGVQIKTTTGQMKPLETIIADIAEKFPKLAKGQQFINEFFKEVTKGAGATGTQGTIQARRAFTFLIRQQGAYRRILRLTTHDQVEFWKSFRALQASPEVKWRIFVNQLHALAIEIGQYAIPALMKMLSPIQKAVTWFEKLGKEQKRSIANIAVWTGGILLVSGTLAVLIGTIGRIIATFAKFGKTLAGAQTAEVALAAETGAISAPLAVLLGAATALLILYIKYPKEFKKVTSAFFDLGVSMGELKKGIRDFLPIADKVIRWAHETYDALDRLKNFGPIKITVRVAMHLPGIGGPLRGIADTIKSPFKAAFGELAGIVAPELPLLHNLATVGGLVAGHFHHASRETHTFGEELRRIARLTRNIGIATLARQLGHLAGAANYAARGIRMVGAAMRTLPQEQVRAAHAQRTHNQQIQHYIALAVAANKIAAQHPKNFQDQLRAAQIMAQINKRFKGAELDAIQAIISADNTATKKRTANAKKAAKAVADTLREAVDNMRSIYDNFVQQNQQILGDITQGIRTQNALEFGAMPSPGDLLADLRQQVHKFEAFRHELDQLAARGFPFALIQQLEQAGISAEPIARGLLHMNRRQMGQYIALFKRGAADVQKAAKIDFNFQLADWRKHGRRAAILFMRGIADEKTFISKEMRRIFLAWLRGHTAASLGRRPPRVPPHRPPPRHPPHHRPPHHRQRHLQSTSTTHHTEIHHNDNKVVVHQGQEDLSTTIRKARRHQRLNASRIRPV